MPFRFIPILIPLLLLATNLQSAAWYVSATTGSDVARNGSRESPYRSIQSAIEQAAPGDTVRVQPGTYRETVRPPRSGTAAAPIRLIAAGEGVVINGTDPLVAFSDPETGLHRIPDAGSVTQLFVNGDRLPLARWPDAGDPYLDKGTWARSVTMADRIRFPDADWAPDRWAGGFAVAIGNASWIAASGDIVSSTADGDALLTNPSEWLSHGNSRGPGRGYIIDTPAAISTAGEWAHAGDDILVLLPADFNPATDRLGGRVREYGMDLAERSHITVSGIDFFACSVNLRDAEQCVLENADIQFPRPFWRFREQFNRNVYTAWRTGFGVFVSGRENLIQACSIRHSWGDGVTVRGESNTVRDCVIEDVNWIGLDCAPLALRGPGHRIEYNTIRDCGRSAIRFQITDGIIRGNDVSGFGALTDDLGGLYTFRAWYADTLIEYNWIHDAAHRGNVNAIYIDNDSSGFVIRRNVIWNVTGGIGLNPSSSEIRIHHNTLLDIGRNHAVDIGTILDDNYVYRIHTVNNLSDKAFEGTTLGGNVQTGAPLLADPDGLRFVPLAPSPAIDAGIILEDGEAAFSGPAPDAGAYEHGQPDWKAGARISDTRSPFPGWAFWKPELAGWIWSQRTGSWFHLSWPVYPWLWSPETGWFDLGD